MDGDGDLDCIVGREDGRLLFFRNKTNGLLADFEFINILKNNLNTEIDIGQNAFPNLVDIDRNGTLDLIIGERNGNLNYYKNIGTQNAPIQKTLDILYFEMKQFIGNMRIRDDITLIGIDYKN